MNTIFHSSDKSLYIANKDDPSRSNIEGVIRNQFLKVHHAQITHYAPSILCLYNNQELVSSIGITCAAEQPLFVERYFQESLESTIKMTTECDAQRSEIIELGNFSSFKRNGGNQLIFITAAWIYLYKHHFKHILFTLTNQVARQLISLNFPLVYIQEASNQQLSNREKKQWGTYYNQKPSIYYISINKTISILKKHAPDIWHTSLTIAKQYTPTQKQANKTC